MLSQSLRLQHFTAQLCTDFLGHAPSLSQVAGSMAQPVRISRDHQKIQPKTQQNAIFANAADRGPYRRAPRAHRLNWNGTRRSVSIATAKPARGTECSAETG